MVKHTAYANGTIRDAQGKLVAFFDAQEQQLTISGFVLTFHAPDIERAMEIVGRRVPGPQPTIAERRQAQVTRFMADMNCTEQAARGYLEAEGWIDYEARDCLRADRRHGITND
jgi:hypothetical protein